MKIDIRICGMTRRPAHSPFFVEEDETLGQRLSRYRRERGLTQIELAKKMESIQTLISDYERDQLRPHPEMLVKFAAALEVSADELLGLKNKPRQPSSSRRWVRRVQDIEKLSKRDQDALVRTIDAFLAKAS